MCASQYTGPPLNFVAPAGITSEYNCVPQAAAQAWPQPIYQPQPQQQQQASQPPCPECCCQGEWREYKLIPVNPRGGAQGVSWQDAKTIKVKENAQGVPCAVKQGDREFCPAPPGTPLPERVSVTEQGLIRLERKVDRIGTNTDEIKGDVKDIKGLLQPPKANQQK